MLREACTTPVSTSGENRERCGTAIAGRTCNLRASASACMLAGAWIAAGVHCHPALVVESSARQDRTGCTGCHFHTHPGMREGRRFDDPRCGQCRAVRDPVAQNRHWFATKRYSTICARKKRHGHGAQPSSLEDPGILRLRRANATAIR
jgi:hypothetical protein